MKPSMHLHIKIFLHQHFRNPWGFLLAIMLAFAFIHFLFNIKDYGTSYDEPLLYDYAERMVTAYQKTAFGQHIDPFLDFYDLPYYGPAYLILGHMLIKPLLMIFPWMDKFDAWHIVNFSTFLLGTWLVYQLSRRVASKPASVLASGLFLTQPLLWGHGVMNPKDTAFMTAFLAVMAAGLTMVDHLNLEENKHLAPKGKPKRRFSKPLTIMLMILALGIFILLIDRIFVICYQ